MYSVVIWIPLIKGLAFQCFGVHVYIMYIACDCMNLIVFEVHFFKI